MAITITRDAPTVAQINTVTPANVESTDQFYVRLADADGNSHEIGFTATAATVANVVTGLQAAAAAADTAGTAPWNAVTCTDDTTHMTITADTGGVPFWVTTRTVDGGGTDDQTLTDANTTACAGPAIWNTAENWDDNTGPAANADAIVPADATSGGTLYGDDYTATELDTLIIERGCVLSIGSRARPLKLNVDETVELGGIGATYLYLDVCNSVVVSKAGLSGGVQYGVYSLNLTGGTVDELNILTDPNEKTSIAALAGETGTFTTINILNGHIVIGSGVTNTTLNISGGTVENRAASGTVNQRGGELRQEGAVSTALNVEAGTCYYKAVGTVPTVNISGSGVVDRREDKRAVTFTQTNVYAGAVLNDPYQAITFTNGIDLVRCGLRDVTLDIGTHKSLVLNAV
jgi:hypothetical protein